MNKIILTLVLTSIILYGIALLTKNAAVSKENVIIKQNNKEIFVKEYHTNITLNNSLKYFDYTIDSTLMKYKQKQILYEGKILHAQHAPHQMVIKFNKQKQNKNILTKYIITKDVAELLSCSQIDTCEQNIGKIITITQLYYPKETVICNFK